MQHCKSTMLQLKKCKWVIDLKVKWKAVKLLEEYIGENLCGIALRKEFSHNTKKTNKPKNKQKNPYNTKLINWTSSKLKSFVLQKTLL